MHWCQYVFKRNQMRVVLQSISRRLQHSLQQSIDFNTRTSFRQWKQATDLEHFNETRAQRIRFVFQRFTGHVWLQRGWNTWKQHHLHQLQIAKHIMRTLQKLQQHIVFKCFTRWCTNVQQKIRSLHLMRRAAVLFSKRTLMQGWCTWQQFVTHRLQFKKTVYHCITTTLHRKVRTSFQRLRLHVVWSLGYEQRVRQGLSALNGIAVRFRYDTMDRGMRQWWSVVRSTRLKKEKMSHLLSVWRTSLLIRTWTAWSTTYMQHQRHQHVLLEKIVRQIQYNRNGKCFRAWCKQVNTKVAARRVLQRLSESLHQRRLSSMRRCLLHWCFQSRETTRLMSMDASEQRHVQILHRHRLTRLRSIVRIYWCAHLRTAFNSWWQTMQAFKRIQHLSIKVHHRWNQKCLFSAFNQWQHRVQEHSRQRNLLKRITTRLRQRCIVVVFDTWVVYTENRMDRFTKLKRFVQVKVQQWLHSRYRQVFRQLQLHALTKVVQGDNMRTIRRVFGALHHRLLFAGWSRWYSSHRTSVLQEQLLLRATRRFASKQYQLVHAAFCQWKTNGTSAVHARERAVSILKQMQCKTESMVGKAVWQRWNAFVKKRHQTRRMCSRLISIVHRWTLHRVQMYLYKWKEFILHCLFSMDESKHKQNMQYTRKEAGCRALNHIMHRRWKQNIARSWLIWCEQIQLARSLQHQHLQRCKTLMQYLFHKKIHVLRYYLDLWQLQTKEQKDIKEKGQHVLYIMMNRRLAKTIAQWCHYVQRQHHAKQTLLKCVRKNQNKISNYQLLRALRTWKQTVVATQLAIQMATRHLQRWSNLCMSNAMQLWKEQWKTMKRKQRVLTLMRSSTKRMHRKTQFVTLTHWSWWCLKRQNCRRLLQALEYKYKTRVALALRTSMFKWEIYTSRTIQFDERKNTRQHMQRMTTQHLLLKWKNRHLVEGFLVWHTCTQKMASVERKLQRAVHKWTKGIVMKTYHCWQQWAVARMQVKRKICLFMQRKLHVFMQHGWSVWCDQIDKGRHLFASRNKIVRTEWRSRTKNCVLLVLFWFALVHTDQILGDFFWFPFFSPFNSCTVF